MTDPCPACGDRGEGRIAYQKGRWRVMACRSCGHGVTDPRPTEEALEDVYGSPEYFEERGLGAEHVSGQRERARMVRGVAAGPRLLDVGSGTGTFLAAAAQVGFQGVGVEISPYAAGIARERLGLEVRRGPFEADRFREGERFHVVTMFHVLEHLADPVAALRLARSRLLAGGCVVVEVPNPGSPVIRHSRRKRNEAFDLPVHLHHFTARSLRLMLGAAEFHVDAVLASVPSGIDRFLAGLRELVGRGADPAATARDGATSRPPSPGWEPGAADAATRPGATPGARIVAAVRRWLPGHKLTAVGRIPGSAVEPNRDPGA